MRFAPLWRVNANQARKIRVLLRLTERQRTEIDFYRVENESLRSDLEVVALMVPRDQRAIAMSLVRDRRRIQRLDQTEEVGG